jgi:hypothetical protein
VIDRFVSVERFLHKLNTKQRFAREAAGVEPAAGDRCNLAVFWSLASSVISGSMTGSW